MRLSPARTPHPAALLAASVLLTGCSLSGHAGNAQTDRQADTLASAISYPVQSSAQGWADAARWTSLGQSERFAVLEVRDMPSSARLEPSAEIVILIHQPRSEAGLIVTEAVTACYQIVFNAYGAMGTSRTGCPEDARPDR